MKKTISFLLSCTILASLSACGSTNSSETASSAEPVQTESLQPAEPSKLTNKMTENELQWVNRHKLTLLDQYEKPNADPNAEHKVSIEFVTFDTERFREYLEENRELFTDEEYDAELKKLQKRNEKDEDTLSPSVILVDGYHLPYLIPTEEDFDDDGSFWFTMSQSDQNGEPELVKESFRSFEEYLKYVRERDTEWGYSKELVDTEAAFMQIAYDALKNGEYETLPEGSVDLQDPSVSLWRAFNDDNVVRLANNVERFFKNRRVFRPPCEANERIHFADVSVINRLRYVRNIAKAFDSSNDHKVIG